MPPLSPRVIGGGTAPIILHNFYVPAGGDEPDPEINPKFGHKLDFVAEMNDWFGDGSMPTRHHGIAGRRPQHRAARARCLVAQAASEDRQPHAGRDRGLEAMRKRPAAGST